MASYFRNAHLTRRFALSLPVALAATPVRAQAWPTRPVRLVVPFPPGGPADAIGRIVAERLAEIWGQPVIIDTRGGAHAQHITIQRNCFHWEMFFHIALD